MSADETAQLSLVQEQPPTALELPARDALNDEFDWKTDPSVILKSQRATAVYENPFGCLVIRQEREWCDDEDPFIVIAPEQQQTLIDCLCDRLGIGKTG